MTKGETARRGANGQHRTVGWNCMKLTHSFHRHTSLSHERSEQCGASEWVSGASERANAGANGPVLYALISQLLCPPWTGEIKVNENVKKAHQQKNSWEERVLKPVKTYRCTLSKKGSRKDESAFWKEKKSFISNNSQEDESWVRARFYKSKYKVQT